VRKFYIAVLALSATVAATAQSIDYSQPYTNLLYTNPAFAGTNVCPRIYINHRSKNLGYDIAYQSHLISYDQAIRAWELEIGALLFHDRSGRGALQHTQLSPILGKAVSINNTSVLKFAVQADIIQHSLDFSGRTYPDMIDSRYGFVYPTSETYSPYSKVSAGAAAGVLYYTSKLYAGVSLHNITRPKTGNSDQHTSIPRRFSAHAGYKATVARGVFYRNNLSLQPAVYFQHEQRYNLLQPGATAEYKNISIGAFGRVSGIDSFDSFSPMVGFQQKRFKFAYTCDIFLAGHKRGEYDTHEISLTIFLDCSKFSPKPRSISCPGG
jgi:type IX secretion system PorP/SprF family membrane protein